MRFNLQDEPWVLRGYVPELFRLAGEERWLRRASQITSGAVKSPYLSEIAADYHWIELVLADEFEKRTIVGADSSTSLDPLSLRALRFAQTTVEVHRLLSAVGKRSLEGRLRDALQAETGFASLYQEVELASVFIRQHFGVDFPDLEGTARADLAFRGPGPVVGQAECKALSADAGRKIHRKDFYRFMESISRDLWGRLSADGADDLLVITLEDRLKPNHAMTDALGLAVRHVLVCDTPFVAKGEFEVSRTCLSPLFGGKTRLASLSNKQFYAEAKDRFGDNCHISGAKTDQGGCLVLMRSKKLDDTSKPKLDAMKEAASQLEGNVPGLIAIQLNEVSSSDLTLPHLRERLSLLCWSLFYETGADHVAAVYFKSFGATSIAADATHAPAILVWNPRCTRDTSGWPFRTGISHEEFSRMLGVEPKQKNPEILLP